MGDFFHSWRRKIGSVTLLMACVFAVGWVRSTCLTDNLWAHIGQEDNWTSIGILSNDQQLAVIRIKAGPQPRPKQSCGWEQSTIAQGRDTWRDLIDWKSQWFGIGFSNKKSRFMTDAAFTPYCTIVIPLTLLSAWLLLINPRTPKPETPISCLRHATN